MSRLVRCLFLSTLIAPGLAAQTGRTAAPSKHGMVASAHYLASEVGDRVLQHGGNAVDAAVATAFALEVVYPTAGNIGGGGFLVYHSADGKVTTFNLRERAPLASTERMYLDEQGNIRNNSNHDGILAVGVPGTVAGFWMAHQKYGKRPWAELLQPAVDLAEKGIPSSWAMQNIQKRLAAHPDSFATMARAFLKNGAGVYEPGELWKQPDLAATLKRIQKDGRDGFYRGVTAKLIADYMKKEHGLITEEDLAKYEPAEMEPVHGTFRGYDVYGSPPPTSGGVSLIEMLNILEGYDLKAMGHNSAIYLHLVTEAMRRAFADRAQYLGDPEFVKDMPVARLTSKEYAADLRKTIDPYHASRSDPARFAIAGEEEETTHFSVVDSAGGAVSITYTLEQGYGAKMVVEGAGFLLNNQMGDFNAIPGRTDTTGTIGTPPNLVAPGKRMLSSMSPTIIAKDGKVVLVVGSPGGRTIINTVLQVTLNVLENGMDVAQATEAPRIHHQWLPDVTTFERWGISPDTKQLYENMGHRTRIGGPQGSVMAIYVDREHGLLLGASDSREFDGRAVGN